MMSRAKTVLLILGIAMIGGCSSHGKKILTAFQQEETTTETLQEKVNWLEPVIAEGKTHEQFRIVKSLRYISKYETDPEKRNLAIQGLVFITVFSRDADVRSSAQSRLTAILNDRNESLEARFAVIDGKKELVLGRFFYEEKDPSLFSDIMEIELEYPDEDDREDALFYLIKHFEEMEVSVQLHMIQAFNEILGNQPVCLEKSDDGCEEYDAEMQATWKQTLGRQISYWSMNTCEWDKDVVSPAVRTSLQELRDDYPDLISDESPECAPFHPAMEDYTVLEMRSIKIPDSYWQFGLELTDAPSDGIHASNIEFGFGNGKSFGIILGINIDEQWVEPLREKYITIQYRPLNSNTAIGATRTIRTSDFSLNESAADDADGVVDDESQYTYGVDENEVFIASTVDLKRLDSHLHLYLGPINQKFAWQYFFRKPDISFIAEGMTRAEMKVKNRETDTVLNEDKNERESQASDLRTDLLLGAKWNNVSLLRQLFIGRSSRAARHGIFNFKLYHSLKREKTYFVVTSPF